MRARATRRRRGRPVKYVWDAVVYQIPWFVALWRLPRSRALLAKALQNGYSQIYDEEPPWSSICLLVKRVYDGITGAPPDWAPPRKRREFLMYCEAVRLFDEKGAVSRGEFVTHFQRWHEAAFDGQKIARSSVYEFARPIYEFAGLFTHELDFVKRIEETKGRVGFFNPRGFIGRSPQDCLA